MAKAGKTVKVVKIGKKTGGMTKPPKIPKK